MKRLLPFFLLTFALLLGSKAYSKTYLDKNPEWMVYIHNVFTGSTNRMSFYLQGDSIINGKQYQQLYMGNQYGRKRFAFVREENAKIYVYKHWYYEWFEDDILLYDFNLKEGDVFTTNAPNTHMGQSHPLEKVSTITLANGEQRKEFQLGAMTWIEGVGDLVDYFNLIEPRALNGDSFGLACYKENGEILYYSEYSCQSTTQDCCDMTTLSLSESLISDVGIKIENGDNCFIITFENMSDKQKTVQLIDISGKVLKEVRTTDENYNLDMLSYAAGVYLVQVECGQAKSVTKVAKSATF